jgi:hypothetical protein
VRTLIAVVAGALLLPAAASQARPAAALTLKAPGKTTFDHRIEFVGRLAPAQPGVRVRLLRAGRFVAAGALRGDGTFRIPVRIASPGPWVVQAAGLTSNPVTVKIVPRLDTELLGTKVVGERLTLQAKLSPAQAGALRVQVIRSGKPTLSQLFRGEATVRLGTTSPDQLRVLVATVPKPGYVPQQRTLEFSLVPPKLFVGSRGPAVNVLVRRLASLHYAVPSTTTAYFDYDVIESVYAFQKVQEVARTGEVDPGVWARLDKPRIPQPRYREPADHIEVDKAHQVLYIVRGGQISLISPVSTAGIAGYYTPVGRFAIYRKVTGYDTSPLGVLLDPMYFVGGYAIHGNPSVPPYPASHGCIRVPNFVIYRLFVTEPYGETVYVY